MRLVLVRRYDRAERKFRLFRLLWERGIIGHQGGWSSMFSVALQPSWVGWSRGLFEWHLWFCGIVLHYHRSFGGRFV